jgi:hypothetical protein
MLAKKLVKWEDHPTPIGAEKSLTAKTFAVNGIVAYLGLFLTAYVSYPLVMEKTGLMIVSSTSRSDRISCDMSNPPWPTIREDPTI